ncbi:unnamed protein product [Eruca vesicaria subsp. sativa]|uniref:Uncharacterized protein n=1 Tax=Eruca vesicaria subsp. sativa TaxID=29727 RepID=A0ABC8ISN7_ERUVS|nr:unnamed protein product [Eruca vesicaria subsp. sativa]
MATSYKAVVVHGDRQNGDRRVGQQNRYQGHRGGDKGKGIAKEPQGDVRMEGSFHPYREKGSRGHKATQYGNKRPGNHSRGSKQAHSNGGHQVMENPEKLTIDAFRGVDGSPPMERFQTDKDAGGGTSSKARKALLFEEEAPGVVVEAQHLENEIIPVENFNGDHVEEAGSDKVVEVQTQSNGNGVDLMAEGEMMSDSELIMEDGELEGWEQGAETNFMEDNNMVNNDQALADLEIANDHPQTTLEAKNLGDTSKGMDGKLKAKNGTVDAGGPSKKRSASVFASPRKKLLAQATAKVGEKGSRKVTGKPKIPPQSQNPINYYRLWRRAANVITIPDRIYLSTFFLPPFVLSLAHHMCHSFSSSFCSRAGVFDYGGDVTHTPLMITTSHYSSSHVHGSPLRSRSSHQRIYSGHQ